MKKILSFFTPAALIVGALGCAHRSNGTDVAVPPRHASGVTAADIERSPGVPLEQLIAARVPGVTLSRARDGRLVMLIRGQSTLGEPQEPLFVVNGVPLGTASNFLAINPNDVESIEVLRDAASTAMYGLMGSAGVILVKTKGS